MKADELSPLLGGRVSERDDQLADASRLRFRLPMVGAILGTAIGVVTAQQLGQAGMKSDIRDILTRMELSADNAKTEAKLTEERGDRMKESIDEMRKRIDLLQLQYQQLRETVMTRGR